MVTEMLPLLTGTYINVEVCFEGSDQRWLLVFTAPLAALEGVVTPPSLIRFTLAAFVPLKSANPER